MSSKPTVVIPLVKKVGPSRNNRRKSMFSGCEGSLRPDSQLTPYPLLEILLFADIPSPGYSSGERITMLEIRMILLAKVLTAFSINSSAALAANLKLTKGEKAWNRPYHGFGRPFWTGWQEIEREVTKLHTFHCKSSSLQHEILKNFCNCSKLGNLGVLGPEGKSRMFLKKVHTFF